MSTLISWFKGAPITISITLAVIFLAAAGVVIGVLFFYDRGFMKRDGHYLKWATKNIPLSIRFMPDVPASLINVLKVVVIQLNKRVGFKLIDEKLRPWFDDGDLTPTNILVELHHEDEETEPQYDKRTGEILAAKLRIFPGWEQLVVITHTRHGIGHSLGLRHDDKKDSVMHAYSERRSKDFTDKDIRRLQKEYRVG